jgi:hypothetical protein
MGKTPKSGRGGLPEVRGDSKMFEEEKIREPRGSRGGSLGISSSTITMGWSSSIQLWVELGENFRGGAQQGGLEMRGAELV